MEAGDVLLIRHAEADYGALAPLDPIFTGMRRDFAPLTNDGVSTAVEVAQRIRQVGVRLIVSSPYTRSLQTAAVIAVELGCPIVVDLRLHDWLPVRDGRESISAAIVAEKIEEHEGAHNGGSPPSDRTWETADEMRGRLAAVVADHVALVPIAIVAHEAPIQSVVGPVPVPPASVHPIHAAELIDSPLPDPIPRTD